jgi:hypothetical protein
VDKHRLSVERSIALHREVARRIRERPELIDAARDRVDRWIVEGSVACVYAAAWRNVLAENPAEIANAIVKDGEDWDSLRRVSPFAGVIDPRTRWRILENVRGASSDEAT